MYETRIDIFNKLRDEKRVKDICNKLNSIVRDILDIEPQFIYFGSKENGYYTIYNENKYDSEISIDLNFILHYLNKSLFLYDKEARDLNDEEFEKYVECKYNQSKLFCAEINWFSINPKRKGYGTKVISELINIINITESVEMILLHSKEDNSRAFWIKNNFREYNDYDKRLANHISDDMIYKY